MSGSPVRDRTPPPPPNHGTTVRARKRGDHEDIDPAELHQVIRAVQALLKDGVLATDVVRLCHLPIGFEPTIRAIGRAEVDRLSRAHADAILEGSERYWWGDRTYQRGRRRYTRRQHPNPALLPGTLGGRKIAPHPPPRLAIEVTHIPPAPRLTLRERLAAKNRGER